MLNKFHICYEMLRQLSQPNRNLYLNTNPKGENEKVGKQKKSYKIKVISLNEWTLKIFLGPTPAPKIAL